MSFKTSDEFTVSFSTAIFEKKTDENALKKKLQNKQLV